MTVAKIGNPFLTVSIFKVYVSTIYFTGVVTDGVDTSQFDFIS